MQTPQDTPQVRKLLKIVVGEHKRQQLQDKLKLSDREHFKKSYLQPALDMELIEPIIPDKPTSGKQKYRLTPKGKSVKKNATG